jgi:hypothetical protein
MKLTMIIAAVAASLVLAACDSGSKTAAPDPAVAAAAKEAADAKAAAEAAAAEEAEKAKVAAMNAPYADEATFTAACVANKAGGAPLDPTVCACVAKQTVKTLGQPGLLGWVFEGYVDRNGTAQMRSRKWFTDNNVDAAGQQKFADAVGTCYVTQ